MANPSTSGDTAPFAAPNSSGMSVGDRARLGVIRAMQQQRARLSSHHPYHVPGQAGPSRGVAVRRCLGDEPCESNTHERLPPPVEGSGCSSGEVSGASRLRCPFPSCPASQVRSPGWADLSGVSRHVNRIHLPAGEVPPQDFLDAFRLGICPRCRILFSVRAGCRGCKHRPMGAPITTRPTAASHPRGRRPSGRR